MMFLKGVKKGIATLVIMVVLAGQTTTSMAWDSRNGDELDTHKLIVEQGLTILSEDLAVTENKEMQETLKMIVSQIKELKRGSAYPDFEGNTFSLYQDHFYEPYTNTNFTNCWWYPGKRIQVTAKDRVLELTREAVELWRRGDKQQAVFKLGCGLHFFGDLTQPHHTSLRIDCMGGPGTAHSKFETWVEENKEQYRLDSAGSNTTGYAYRDIKNHPNMESFLNNECFIRASSVNHYVPITLLTNSWEEWQQSADYGMRQAQIGTARIIYGFIKEITAQ